MSTKALRKELLAAIAMVIVAAIALSGSTYAWFANNNKVTAENLQVKAAVEGGIEIARTSKGAAEIAHKTIDGSTLERATLYPTSTVTGAAWSHASAKLVSSSTAITGTYTTVAIKESAPKAGVGYVDYEGGTPNVYDKATDHAFYLVDTFNIRSTSGDAKAKGLQITSITVSPSAANYATMSAAMRVGIVLDHPNKSTDMAVYAPIRDAALTYDVFSDHTGEGETAVAVNAGTVTAVTSSTAIELLAETYAIDAKDTENGKNGGVDVYIYVWFEGEDEELYTENFKSEDLDISVSFQSKVD